MPSQKASQFHYNPEDPKRSFDVYIDKNPDDTINIRYKTVADVKHTIRKLEALYQSDSYPHKRIWQVAMIMRVRLGVILKHHQTRYPGAKQVKSRYHFANCYFKFLGERTQLTTTKARKGFKFRFNRC